MQNQAMQRQAPADQQRADLTPLEFNQQFAGGPSVQLQTKFEAFASRVCELARMQGFEAEWGRTPAGLRFYAEVWGVSEEQFEAISDAAYRVLSP